MVSIESFQYISGWKELGIKLGRGSIALMIRRLIVAEVFFIELFDVVIMKNRNLVPLPPLFRIYESSSVLSVVKKPSLTGRWAIVGRRALDLALEIYIYFCFEFLFFTMLCQDRKH